MDLFTNERRAPCRKNKHSQGPERTSERERLRARRRVRLCVRRCTKSEKVNKGRGQPKRRSRSVYQKLVGPAFIGHRRKEGGFPGKLGVARSGRMQRAKRESGNPVAALWREGVL